MQLSPLAMPLKFKRGLIVGKFSPLHLGHEYLIRSAAKECDELVILSWSKPEFAGCDSHRRRHWLHTRFPHLRVLVLDDDEWIQQTNALGLNTPSLPDNNAAETELRFFVGWVCENHLNYQPDVVFTSENYGDDFAAALTHYFRAHSAKAAEVVHRCVDQARSVVPISGTQLRENPHAHRAFLAPEIYADFVERIVLLGGESTGKTTLAAALAQTLQTQWAAEYGRELWETKNGALDYVDMLHIAQMQITREENLAKSAQRFLVCDSSPLTTYFYSLALFDRAEPELALLAERHYSHVFLCAADFDFVQDGTRRDNNFRNQQQHWYQQQLTARKIPYVTVYGDIETRLQQIKLSLAKPSTIAAA